MNISWHPVERVFIAEFDEFQGDLEAAKAAGFKPLGVPPPWIWHAPSPGVKALNRLREKRPASGLTISPEALEIYKPLAELEAKNLEVRKQLTEAKKKNKKAQKEKQQKATTDTVFTGLTDEKWWIGVEDLPPMPPYVPTYTVSTTPTTGKICEGCGDRLYFYEYPNLCLWCEGQNILEKTLDNLFG
jgi:hypothetical protein